MSADKLPVFLISIHAPVKGATSGWMRISRQVSIFQSTHP